MNIFKIIFFLFLAFLSVLWVYFCYYVCLGIVKIFDLLLDYYKNRRSKNKSADNAIEERTDINQIKELFASMQGMQVDFVTIDDEETYLSVYDEKALTISLESTSDTITSLTDGCFLVPAYTWKLVYNKNSKQAEQLICSYADSLETIEKVKDSLEGKKLLSIEFFSDAIQCYFEDITLHMHSGHNDMPTCYIELFMPDGQTRTLAIKPIAVKQKKI